MPSLPAAEMCLSLSNFKALRWDPYARQRSPKPGSKDVKARVRRAISDLEAIEQIKDQIFQDPRAVFLDLVLAVHQLEAAIAKCRQAWWP